MRRRLSSCDSKRLTSFHGFSGAFAMLSEQAGKTLLPDEDSAMIAAVPEFIDAILFHQALCSGLSSTQEH
jgi:hypothetical protein